MARQDSEIVDALADALAGAVILVMGGAHTGYFGFVEQRIATVIGVKVDGGPAEPLINEVTRQFRTLTSPAATKVGMIDRSWDQQKLTEAGTELLLATLPKLASLATDQREQIDEWLVSVAQRVAEAAHDEGETNRVSTGERAAIQRLRELLS